MSSLSDVKMIHDWVLIRKNKDFDNPRESGGIVIPDTVNIHRRESKIGKIISFGPGVFDRKGRWIPVVDLKAYSLVYYTRYGKHIIEGKDIGPGSEDDTYIICKADGVLARILLNICDDISDIYPRMDYLWTERLPREKVKASGIVIPMNKAQPFEYEPYQIHTKGPFIYWSAKEQKMVDHPERHNVNPGQVIWSTEQNGVQISFRKDGKLKVYRLVSFDDCIMTLDYADSQKLIAECGL